MKIRVRIKVDKTISITFPIITLAIFCFLSRLLSEPLILYLGIPFSLTTFFFLNLLHVSEKRICLNTSASTIKLLLCPLTILSILTVLLVPPLEGVPAEWMSVLLPNWIRCLSSIVLTSFIPGYFLLQIIDRGKSIKGIATIVISYLLSLFITSIVGFLILLTGNSISSVALQTILAINLLLMLVYFVVNITSINFLESLLLLFVLLTVTISSLFVMLYTFPINRSDMPYHLGLALKYSKSFPVYGGFLIPAYPYFFHLYLGALFSLSGIMPAVVEQSLYILNFMPVLAFYSAVEEWFNEKKDKRIALIATSLSILLGFGGLYMLYLRCVQPAFSITQLLSIATYKTYDIYMRILLLPDIVAPIWNIGLPVLLMLLYFLRKDTYSYTKKAIVPILIALGWLGHIAEPIIFIFILLVYTLFFRQSRGGGFGPHVMLGLFLVAIVDLIAPAQIYLRSVKEEFSTPFFTSLSLSMLITVIEVIEDKLMVNFSTNIKNFTLKRLETVWRFGRWILLYAYIFPFIVWLAVEKNFNLWEWGGYSSVPFFVFPLRFGAVGLLAVTSIFLYFTKIVRDRDLLFFLMLIPLGFMLEQIAEKMIYLLNNVGRAVELGRNARKLVEEKYSIDKVVNDLEELYMEVATVRAS